MTATLYRLWSRSQRPDGREVPRSALRGLHDEVRPLAEVVRIRDRIQAQLPSDVEPTNGDAA